MSLKKLVQKLPKDKKEHIIVGVVYSLLIPILSFIFGFYGGLIGFLLGTYFNLYKEIKHDLIDKKGTPEFLDFLATETPILITFLTYII